jgi:hypothetical protein
VPNFTGMDPNGAGPMSGRSLGRCGDSAESAVFGRGRGYHAGFGRGFGHGIGYGRNRGMGWMAVCNGPGGEKLAQANMRVALEECRDYLHAELARTEALLAEGEHVEETRN